MTNLVDNNAWEETKVSNRNFLLPNVLTAYVGPVAAKKLRDFKSLSIDKPIFTGKHNRETSPERPKTQSLSIRTRP